MANVSTTKRGKNEKPIPVTVFTGFLGAGKTSVILGLLKQLPESYRVVLLKNEYGDIEVDSLLAKESSIAGVSEILNGCMCCTLVGQIQTAMLEIRDKMKPDRIIIESSGSAFPATLAIQIRQLAPEGFSLDAIATVIDCVNFEGYEDTSPTAKLQAKYTDLLLLNKHQLTSERSLDTVIDHLYTLNEDTPLIKVSPTEPLAPSLIFGLDTKLFDRSGLGEEEGKDWELVAGGMGRESHMDEVETRTVWRGGEQPGLKGKAKDNGTGDDQHHGHNHAPGEICDHPQRSPSSAKSSLDLPIKPISNDALNPSPSWRLATILACPILMLALGVPYWWGTTSIERASLPIGEMERLDTGRLLPLRTRIVLGEYDPIQHVLLKQDQIEPLKKRLLKTESKGWYVAEETNDKGSTQKSEEAPQVGILDAHGETLPFVDAVSGTLVVPWAGIQSGAEASAGDEKQLSTDALATLIDATVDSLLPVSPSVLPSRAIKYNQNVTLSFVLLNEDASLGGGYSEWDIEEALARQIVPFLEELKGIHNFAIESQILSHAPLKIRPHQAQVMFYRNEGQLDHEETIFLVSQEQMQSFINAESWTLDSASSRDPVLKFLIYVPAVDKRPLRLEGPTQPTSFLIPQSAGVVIVNPDATQGGDRRFLAEDLIDPFSQVLTQLAALLGVSPLSIPQVGASPGAINPWQREALVRSRAAESYKDSIETLQSLARIVEKTKEMQIPGRVKQDVVAALRILHQVASSSVSNLATLRLCSKAKHLADEAFFNPGMMAMLYFPDEHKYAVYMPLLAPVAVSIMAALLKELKCRRQRRKQAKAKATEVVELRPTSVMEPTRDAISRTTLEAALMKMPFDIYRVKGLVQLHYADEARDAKLHILNWAFGRFTLMGARGEVKRQARILAEALDGQFV